MVDGLASLSVVGTLIFSIPLGISGSPSLRIGASVHPHPSEESMTFSNERQLIVELDLLTDIKVTPSKRGDDICRTVAKPGSNFFGIFHLGALPNLEVGGGRLRDT